MEFRILGALEVWTGAGRRIPLEGSRTERLLATLLLNADSAVPVTRLVDAVWDERPPATAGRQARNLAGLLRRRFAEADPDAPPALLTDGPGYRLALTGHRLDAHRFTELLTGSRRAAADGRPETAAAALREALGLWRGPALDGLSGAVGSPGAVALDELRLTAWEECLDLELALGRHRATVPELTALVADHPLRERFAGQLMRALHGSGRAPEGLAVYRRFADRLAEELGLDPGPELRALHLDLLATDPVRAGSARGEPGRGEQTRSEQTRSDRACGEPGHTDRPEPPDDTPRPAQLPPPLPTFVGREAELGALDRLLTGPAAVLALSGPAGVGKTATAVAWAHRARDRFPDGQLYADLHGFSVDPPLTPHTVLARFLRALGLPGERVPTAPDEAAALYRSLLAGRRLLVVLDNARDADQVRPLLPGAPDCRTVVTSRTRLDGLTARNGARSLVLDVLPAPAALDLLARISGAHRTGAEPGAAAELTAACGHLPLALAISASRLAARPDRSLADHAAELRDEEHRLTALQIDGDATSAVRAAFDLSYRSLPAEAGALLRLLALAPAAEVTADAAAALSGAPTAAVRPVLDRLATAHLLTHLDRDRYRLNELLRLYAGERCAAETRCGERAAARARLCSWYLHHAEAAGLLITPERRRIPLPPPEPWYVPPGFTTPAQAFRWCEEEHTQLLAVIREAARHGRSDHAWQLPVLLWSYYAVSPHLDEWVEADRIAVTAAQRSGDRFGEGHARNDLATALGALGRPDQARAELHRARALLAAAGDQVGEAHVIGNLGDQCLETGEHHQAAAYSREALALLAAQPPDRRDDWAIGALETNLGIAALLAGRPEEAADRLHRCLARHRRTGTRVLEGITLYYLGEHHRRQARPAEAAAHLHQALALLDTHTPNSRLRTVVSTTLAELEAPPPPGAGVSDLTIRQI
ncbi:BTAD domain-containing putative transcriptional regulator [Kitasatospora sp. NPDC096077]|uniref:AfsR/SARP family transcriptional regulator n=1 Tax=Kitasatospora sp. NPDC096077 TaxID=3155544 RepID=UPI0033315AA8